MRVVNVAWDIAVPKRPLNDRIAGNDMQHVNTRKLTRQLNQALRRSWVIIQEKERHLTHHAHQKNLEQLDEAPIDELIETVEQFLDEVKATRKKSNRHNKTIKHQQ